jgi:hypothetical protein
MYRRARRRLAESFAEFGPPALVVAAGEGVGLAGYVNLDYDHPQSLVAQP